MSEKDDRSEQKPGRPARISRAAIAECALEVGLDSATMVTIAGRLGVDHSSLYRHVKGRDDIISAAIDVAVERIDWTPPVRDWREAVEMTAEAAWAMYESHPGLAEAIRTLETTPPAIVRAFAAMCHRLEGFGFARLDAILVVDTVMDMTNDSAVALRRLRQPAQKKGQTVEVAKAQAWKPVEHPDTYAAIGAATWAAYAGDPKGWWRRKLALVLAGAAALHPDIS